MMPKEGIAEAGFLCSSTLSTTIAMKTAYTHLGMSLAIAVNGGSGVANSGGGKRSKRERGVAGVAASEGAICVASVT